MGRSFDKAIKDGKVLAQKRTKLDISVNEVNALFEPLLCAARAEGVTGDKILDTIINAYYAGLAIGHRNTKRQIEKER